MFKRIKILIDIYDVSNNSQKDAIVEALITEHGNSICAAYNAGFDWPNQVSYVRGTDEPSFEIIGDIQQLNPIEKEVIKHVEVPAEIKRGTISEGYVIIACEFLDDVALEFIEESDIINRKELIAMCTAAQMEINKGDVSPKSLNVKLYKALRTYVELEMNKLIVIGECNAKA